MLGYHGCSEDVAEKLLAGESFKKSTNDYDWLGHGIYFWEANPQRGLEFAVEAMKRKRRSSKAVPPSVVGAVIDRGLCLDMTTSLGINQVKIAHEWYVKVIAAAKSQLPKNSSDGLKRALDCAVIEALHQIRNRNGEPSVDTVRGLFVEGDPIYPTAGFREKTHAQICVRTPDMIKGVFRVPKKHFE